MRLTVACPAKVNLFLGVGKPDDTGMHPIRTLFQAVSLYDWLELESAATDSFNCDWDGMPAENTVTRAWRLAREYTELPTVRVSLSKCVPSMSGLGGGSSDAAGFLRAMVRLTRLRFRPEDAVAVAKAVGSDVPYFLTGGLARGEGYGERLCPLADAEPRELVVVMPPATVSTAQAYAALDLTERDASAPADESCGYNDFERVAPKASLEALKCLRSLGTACAGLTGSGAAVYGFFESEQASRDVARIIQGIRKLGRTWDCRTLTREESLWMS